MENTKKYSLIKTLLIIVSTLLISVFFSIKVNAASSYYIPNVNNQTNRIRYITTNNHDISRIYNNDQLIFLYTHDVVYHNNIDGHDYTQLLEVEHNYNAIPTASNFNADITKYVEPQNIDDYTFVGWTDNPSSTNVLTSKTVNSTTDLYAVYKKKIVITCSRGNAIIGTGYEYYTNGIKLQDANITLSAISDPGWINVGYRSDTSNKSIEATYLANKTYTFTSNTTLNVVWYKDITKTAVFNSNGGNAVNNISKTIRLIYNSGNSAFGYYDISANSWISNTAISINLHGNPGRANYNFNGWVLSGTAITYAAGAQYQFAANDASETITFVAGWSSNYYTSGETFSGTVVSGFGATPTIYTLSKTMKAGTAMSFYINSHDSSGSCSIYIKNNNGALLQYTNTSIAWDQGNTFPAGYTSYPGRVTITANADLPAGTIIQIFPWYNQNAYSPNERNYGGLWYWSMTIQ